MSSTRRAVPKPSVLILCLFALSLAGCLTPGIPAPAQDPATYYRDRGDELLSQGKHTPFAFASSGFELPGRGHTTLVAGGVAFERTLA